MSYTAWSVIAGEQPTASKWNLLGSNDASFNNGTGIAALEVGAITAVKNDYKFSVYRNAAWTSSNLFTVVNFDTKTFDTGSNVDITTNKGRFTAPVAGFYYLNGCVNVTGGASTTMSAGIYKNGSLLKQGNTITPPSSNNALVVSGIVQMSASDYAEIWFVGGNGSTGTAGSTYTYFDGCLISNT